MNKGTLLGIFFVTILGQLIFQILIVIPEREQMKKENAELKAQLHYQALKTQKPGVYDNEYPYNMYDSKESK